MGGAANGGSRKPLALSWPPPACAATHYRIFTVILLVYDKLRWQLEFTFDIMSLPHRFVLIGLALLYCHLASTSSPAQTAAPAGSQADNAERERLIRLGRLNEAQARSPDAKLAEAPPSMDEPGWGEPGSNGIRIRLVLPPGKSGKPVLTPDNCDARLEVWNMSTQRILIAEQNLTGGRMQIVDEWIIGLRIAVLTNHEPRLFTRTDDQDKYWSLDSGSANVQPILPGQRLGFGVRLHKLADEAGRSLLELQGDCELQPNLNVIGKSGGSWKGLAIGKPVPARIESPPQIPRSAR
jgi:hypothetical protein